MKPATSTDKTVQLEIMYTERTNNNKRQINLLSQWQMNFVTEIQLKVVEHNLPTQNTENLNILSGKAKIQNTSCLT